MSVVLPFVILLVLAAIRLVLGLARDKPIGFLLAGLLITFFTILILRGSLGRITPAGRRILDRMRGGRKSSPEPGLTSLALFGIAGDSSYASMPEVDLSFQKELDKMSHTIATSSGCGGGGCSSSGDSGCGDSGCGGGGCGGCGGCGG